MQNSSTVHSNTRNRSQRILKKHSKLDQQSLLGFHSIYSKLTNCNENDQESHSPVNHYKSPTTYMKKIIYKTNTIFKVYESNNSNTKDTNQNNINSSQVIILNNMNSFDSPTNQLIVNWFDPDYIQTSWYMVQKKNNFCKCSKSKCSKKYCQCFQKGLVCSSRCQCLQCQNKNHENSNSNLVEPINSLKCNCIHSQCSKKYCECYKQAKLCTQLCNCINCYNKPISRQRIQRNFNHLKVQLR